MSKNATASAGTRSTTVRQTHHLLSWSGCRQQGLLLTSCKQQRATCVACSHSVVRRRCQRSLASRKDAPHRRPSNPTQLVNAHVAAAGSPVPIAGLLILRPPCANSMRCLRCVHALALVLLVLGMDHGCTVCGVVCPTRANTPTRRPGLGRPGAACRTRPLAGPRTRVDRLERMSFSVAISRWADVRVTWYVVRPFHGQGSRISSLFSCRVAEHLSSAQSRAASNVVALAARA